MGNCSSFTLPTWRSQLQRNSLVSIDEGGTHDGIKTIPIQKACEFTTLSVLCVCIITWNMNGKVHTCNSIAFFDDDQADYCTDLMCVLWW